MTEPATELLSRLVECESVNPGLDPEGSGESAVARYAAGWLSDRGIRATVVEPAPGRCGVTARLAGRGDGPTLLLTGHLDTVSLGGPRGAATATVEGDRLYGRGSCDMKGGVAAIMLAAAELAEAGSGGDVVLGLVPDEEHLSLGTLALLDGPLPDAAVVTEPTALRVGVAHKGFAWYRLEASGRAAHGSRPDEGSDAILTMAPTMKRLRDLATRLEAGDGHPLLGPGSVHASTIHGGQEISSYPASCVLEFERRTIPGESVESLDLEARALLADESGLDLRRELQREPFEIDPSHPLVEALRTSAAAVTGIEAECVGCDFWTDAALVAAAGVPTVVFGPGGEGAHAEVEWVSLREVGQCSKALVSLARSLGNPG